jgi:hypothetical protein
MVSPEGNWLNAKSAGAVDAGAVAGVAVGVAMGVAEVGATVAASAGVTGRRLSKLLSLA